MWGVPPGGGLPGLGALFPRESAVGVGGPLGAQTMSPGRRWSVWVPLDPKGGGAGIPWCLGRTILPRVRVCLSG